MNTLLSHGLCKINCVGNLRYGGDVKGSCAEAKAHLEQFPSMRPFYEYWLHLYSTDPSHALQGNSENDASC